MLLAVRYEFNPKGTLHFQETEYGSIAFFIFAFLPINILSEKYGPAQNVVSLPASTLI
jgi:hypothetical protein